MSVESTPIVTVVIPVYNSATTLARAVNSVLGQTLRELELLIIDDGSLDDSVAVAYRLAAIDQRIMVISLPQNAGKASAMNYAATVARGTWIAVLDADDRYLPTRLAAMVEAGETHVVDLVADNQLHTDNATGQVVRQAFTRPGQGRAVGLADFIAHSDPGATFDFGILKPMIRSEFLRRTGLTYHAEARLAEDFYFIMEFFAAGGRAFLLHQALYDWTLPFSPTARRWTGTGAGPWRYNYRNALQTNQFFQQKLVGVARPELMQLLRRREREYGVMVQYLDAQRVLADSGSHTKALTIIVMHPATWPLLARRVAGRLARIVARRSGHRPPSASTTS